MTIYIHTKNQNKMIGKNGLELNVTRMKHNILDILEYVTLGLLKRH